MLLMLMLLMLLLLLLLLLRAAAAAAADPAALWMWRASAAAPACAALGRVRARCRDARSGLAWRLNRPSGKPSSQTTLELRNGGLERRHAAAALKRWRDSRSQQVLGDF